MDNTDFFDFMMEGGDELLNTEVCPHCGEVIYLDQKVEWVDKDKKSPNVLIVVKKLTIRV